jgi:hypothetical protein
LSCEKDMPALSPRVGISALTEPESFGQPEPEKTSFVMRGASGGAARANAGRARRVSDDRMVD